MRILQMGSTAYGGGVSVAVKTLAISLARLGHSVVLVCNGGDLESARLAGVTIVHLRDEHRLMGFLKPSAAIRRLLREFQPDIVHVHSRSYSLLPDVHRISLRCTTPTSRTVFRPLTWGSCDGCFRLSPSECWS